MEFYDASMEAAEEEGLLPACSSGLHSPVSSAATLGAWVRHLQEVEVVESDLHQLVLNYFVVHGNHAAAEAFLQEISHEQGTTTMSMEGSSSSSLLVPCGENPDSTHNGGGSTTSLVVNNGVIDDDGVPHRSGGSRSRSHSPPPAGRARKLAQGRHKQLLANIAQRTEVRSALNKGDAQTALDLLQKFGGDSLLKTRPDLHFALLRWIFVQKVREQDLAEALTFSQEKLAPFVEHHPGLLEDLEDAMSLLAFQPGSAELEENASRVIGSATDLASRVDSMILRFHEIGQTSTLEFLCKNLLWSQRRNRHGPALESNLETPGLVSKAKQS